MSFGLEDVDLATLKVNISVWALFGCDVKVLIAFDREKQDILISCNCLQEFSLTERIASM